MIRATCTSYVLGSLTTTMGLTIECVEGLLRRMLHFCGFCVCVCVCLRCFTAACKRDVFNCALEYHNFILFLKGTIMK